MNSVRRPCPQCGRSALSETLAANAGLCLSCRKRNSPTFPLSPELAARAVPVPSGAAAAQLQADRLERLREPLRALLQAELAVGNIVVETAEEWPQPGSIFVMLGKPFLARPAALPRGVVLREINDPHYWKAEYVDENSAHVLACRF